MSHVLVTGAAGFLGRTVIDSLVRRGGLTGPEGFSPVTKLTLVDRAPANPANVPFEKKVWLGSLLDADLDAMLEGVDVVIHLAASLTIAAEEDVGGGYALNLDIPWRILEAARRIGRRPLMVFPSSIAVFGGTLPDRVTEAVAGTPQTSYGTAKAMVELMLSDYSRHGFVDGRAIRIPIVVTRPGLPSPVVSDIVAEVVRGPLAGRAVVSPLDPDMAFPIVTVERVAENILNLLERPAATFGASRAVHQTGLTTTPREMVASLARLAGEDVAARVSFAPEPAVTRVVASWPRRFESEIADPLPGDPDVDTIVRAAMERIR